MSGAAVAAPYRGLGAYSEADAPFFFGREAQRRLVVANMMSEPLTILYGPSGVGKTSFLHAGVLRHFRELARSRVAAGDAPQLAALVFNSWRDAPVAALQEAVVDAVGQALGRAAEPLPPAGLSALTSWAADAVEGPLYVILDQVEDYFLYQSEDRVPGSFLGEFPSAVNSAAGRVSFLVSVREDALAQLDCFKGEIPSLFANYLRLDHLDREQGRQAIEGPLEVFNATHPDAEATVEPAFVAAVLDSIQTEWRPAGSTAQGGSGRIELPFLQVVLTRVWNAEMAHGSRVLRLRTLEELGGPVHIVRGIVDEAMETLTSREREVASAALLYLVTPSGARIALSATDLVELLARPHDEVLSVLERLAAGDVRILRATPGPHHETLYEVFSDQLVTPLGEWRTRMLGERPVRRYIEEVERERRRVRVLLMTVAVLTALVVLLALLLVRGN